MTNASLLSFTKYFDSEGEDCHYLYEDSVWRQTYLTDVTHANLVALIVINSLEVPPTILLNALIIFAVATRHRLRTNSNILVSWLVGTHLLGGLVGQPMTIAAELRRIFNNGPFCGLEKAVWVAKIGIGLTLLGSLALISIDRYISIKHALRYETIITSQRIKAGLLLAWAIALLVTIHELVLAVVDSGTELYLHYVRVKDVILAILASIDIAIIIYTYSYISSETRRHNKRLQTEQLPQEEAKRLKKENKASKTLTIVLAGLVLTYMPTIILGVAVASSENIFKPHIISVLWSWITVFNQLGSLLDPIIYFWRLKKLRRAILEILHYRQPGNAPPPIEMREIKRYRPKLRFSTCESLSTTVASKD